MVAGAPDAGSAIGAAELLAELEPWLKATKTTISAFGVAVCGDPGMVRRLRAGQRPTVEKAAKARAFIAAQPEGIPPKRKPKPAPAPRRPKVHSTTQKAKAAVEAPPPAAPAPSVAEEVRREAALTGARRRVAQSTGTVKTVLPVAEPEVREAADPERRTLQVPMQPPRAPRRRIPLPSNLSAVETIQSLLAEDPQDLMRAIMRTHQDLWRRCILLGRARGETAAAAMYAALERGLGGLEVETSTPAEMAK
jgi:hypothetical protein